MSACHYLGDFPSLRGKCRRCEDQAEIRCVWLLNGDPIFLRLCLDCRALAPPELVLPRELFLEDGAVFVEADMAALAEIPTLGVGGPTRVGLAKRAQRLAEFGLLCRRKNPSYDGKSAVWLYSLSPLGCATLRGDGLRVGERL